MSLWGNTATANAAPKYKVLDTSAARGNTMYANTFLDAFIPGAVAGVWPANPQAASNNNFQITHAGWIAVRQGTGPLASIALTTPGSGYSNTDVVKVTSYDPAHNTVATASITTNGSGVIQTVTFLTAGSGFVGSETATVANSSGGVSAGTGATFSLKFRGRAGRKQYETLVSGGSYNSTTNLP